MAKFRLRQYFQALAPLLYLLPLAYLLWPVFWKPLDHRFYNYFHAKRAVPSWTHVVVAAIDSRTRDQLLQKPVYPLSRHVDLHASLVDQLTRAGARAVVLDLQLDEDVIGDAPTALADAMRSNGHVYLVTSTPSTATDVRSIPHYGGGQSPMPALVEASRGVLAVNVQVDPDGVLRKFKPATQANRMGLRSIGDEFAGQRFHRSVPIEFPSVDNPIPVASYADILSDSTAVRALLENRIVFVGSTLDDSSDLVIAPRPQRSIYGAESFSMPGVTALAAITETLIDGALIRYARWWNVLLFITLASILAVIPSVRLRPIQLAVWLYAVLCMTVIAAALLHVYGNTIFPTGLLCGSMLVVAIDTLIRAYFTTDKKLIHTLEQSKEELERQVSERTRELSDTNAELKSTLTKLRHTQAQLIQSEKMASLGHLAAGIAHEINNPAGAVTSTADVTRRCAEQLAAQIQKQPAPPKEIERTLNIMKDANNASIEAAARITKVVNSLKNFSRLDEAEVQTVDIHEGLESTLTLLAHEFGDTIEISRNFGDVPPIQCYPAELNQVFMNIIRNACRAITDKGAIKIKTRALNERVYIEFADNGRGIPDKDLGKIFDPGFTGWDVGVGTGLGLSISHNIIQKHRGSIEVASTPGRGSVFTVILPLNK
ncbi:MAG: CHASE2 domain-containing protein [Candidatus Latescibacterota bacterium]|nr:MAG: CHASE2 domain-containing protein [Candidatus Latescibacterota bacterium]